MNAAAGSVTTMMAIPAFRPSNAGSKSLRRGLPPSNLTRVSLLFVKFHGRRLGGF